MSNEKILENKKAIEEVFKYVDVLKEKTPYTYERCKKHFDVFKTYMNICAETEDFYKKIEELDSAVFNESVRVDMNLDYITLFKILSTITCNLINNLTTAKKF